MAERTQPDIIFKPRDDLGVEQIEDDLVILDKCNQKVHQLNSTASAVWQRIKDGREPERIAQEIVEIFDISPDVALQDVTRILEEFAALGLLEDTVVE